MANAPAALVGTMLHVCMPGVSRSGRDVIDLLIEERGCFGSADRLARLVGLRNRHQLAYTLRGDGLPQLQRLAGWIRLLLWVAEYESEGISLCRSSLDEARDPAFRYRLVKRITGLEWTVVRARGLVWLVYEFVGRCSPSVRERDAALRERDAASWSVKKA
jgi:hypothetical protein